MGKNRLKMFCILSAKKYTRLYKAVGVMTNMLFYMGYWYFHVDELKIVAEEDIHGFPRVISSMTEATYFTKHGGRHNRRRHRVLKLYQENMYQHKLRPHHQHSNCVKITKKYFRRSLLKRGARAKTRSKSLFTRMSFWIMPRGPLVVRVLGPGQHLNVDVGCGLDNVYYYVLLGLSL